jgi:hypothetical protein
MDGAGKWSSDIAPGARAALWRLIGDRVDSCTFTQRSSFTLAYSQPLSFFAGQFDNAQLIRCMRSSKILTSRGLAASVAIQSRRLSKKHTPKHDSTTQFPVSCRPVLLSAAAKDLLGVRTRNLTLAHPLVGFHIFSRAWDEASAATVVVSFRWYRSKSCWKVARDCNPRADMAPLPAATFASKVKTPNGARINRGGGHSDWCHQNSSFHGFRVHEAGASPTGADAMLPHRSLYLGRLPWLSTLCCCLPRRIPAWRPRSGALVPLNLGVI